MITPQEYINAISARLQERFPDDPVKPYENIVPKDFERPSCLVECAEVTMEPAGLDTADIPMRFIIRTYVNVDEYHNSHFSDLYRRATIIYSEFIDGFLTVKDPADGHERCPKITQCKARVWKDYADVELKTQIQMDRQEFEEIPTLPTMQDIQTRIQAE